jgi:hypothetical protein
MASIWCSAAVAVGVLAWGVSPVAANDLADLNSTARAIYADGRAALLAAADPVIVVAFDDLILHHGGKVLKQGYTPPIYHRLKGLAHLPLGIGGAVIPVASGAVAADNWRDDLARLSKAATAVADDIEAFDTDEPTKAAARKMTDASIAYIEACRAADTAPDWVTFQAYARAIAPPTLALATVAANTQLDGLHALVQRWKAEVGPEAWAKLHVLVLGPKTPRVDNLAYQYFVAELGPGSGETRVIYTESVFDEKAALQLLGVLLIDRRVGEAFFGDPGRMERDLLADAATAKVLRLFGKLGAN